MVDAPDFEALRAERNAAVQSMVEAIAKDHGWDAAEVQTSFDPLACYCACPDGPCEHDFQGCYDFKDGSSGETVCRRCGQSAMLHSVQTSE